MTSRPFPLSLAAAFIAVASLNASAQSSQSQASQFKSVVQIRQMRVDLLRDEIKQDDARIESRLDTIIKTLCSIKDSKDSRTKVARMKEDTMKRLYKTIGYYDQKRAAMKEELRNPRLKLTTEEKEKVIAVFDARIERRIQQILALYQSMPTHKDYDQYKVTSGGWHGTEYKTNDDYEQNRMITTHTNAQRNALMKELDKSIARLESQNRSLRAQATGATDPAQVKMLTNEIARNDALIRERRKQRLDILSPSETPANTVALKTAMDMDKALQTAIADLKGELNSLFYRYNSLIQELSSLHEAELKPAG